MSRSRLSVVLAVFSIAFLLMIVPATAHALTWPEPVDRGAAYGLSRSALGYAVAVWGDTMVVSEPGASVGTTLGAGAVRFYVRQGPAWRLAQTITSTRPQPYGSFGSAVALGWYWLVIGAPGEDLDSGAVYVFRRSDGSWVPEDRFAAPSGVTRFGEVVSLFADKIVVGCPNFESNKGRVYLYRYAIGGVLPFWEYDRSFTGPASAAGDRFGRSVAMYGDDLVIGAPWETVSTNRAGAVHVYRWSSSADEYQHVQRIPAPVVQDDGIFGFALALERDNLVVGAPGLQFGTALMHGYSFLYQRPSSTWQYVAALQPSSSLGANAYAGCSVALSGDTIAIGAYGADTYSGLVQMFSLRGLPTTVLQQATTIDRAECAPGSQFGRAVALSGGNLVCGAPFHDLADPDVGLAAAYTFKYPLWPDRYALRVSGADRYLTNVEASKRGFPFGAPAVVVCTGENWPDALGGAGLAGAVHGPVLLTRASALPAATVAEIKRLGAVKAYVVGGTGAVSAGVMDALRDMLGYGNVWRLYGPNRYATAQAVAAETIRVRGSTYAGGAFVATGGKYPDAVAVSPLAAYLGTPIVLSNPASSTVDLPPPVTQVVVAGGEGAVSADQFNDLVAKLGASNVVRKHGLDRYETAAALAQYGVDGGMNKNGVGLATGEKFPDALSAGPMLGAFGCPLLLTRSTVLSPATDALLRAWRPNVMYLHVIGGTGVVTDDVKNAAAAAAWGP